MVPRTDSVFCGILVQTKRKITGKLVPTLSRRRCDRIILSREFNQLVAYLRYKPCLFSLGKSRSQ